MNMHPTTKTRTNATARATHRPDTRRAVRPREPVPSGRARGGSRSRPERRRAEVDQEEDRSFPSTMKRLLSLRSTLRGRDRHQPSPDGPSSETSAHFPRRRKIFGDSGCTLWSVPAITVRIRWLAFGSRVARRSHQGRACVGSATCMLAPALHPSASLHEDW